MPDKDGRMRTNDDGTLIEPRPKRAKYAATACDTCRKRKIRCNIESDATICRRCRAQGVECIFSTSDTSSQVDQPAEKTESVESRLARFEQRLGSLQSDFEDHCLKHDQAGADSNGRSPSNTDRRTVRHHHQPSFVGPTRPAFAFNIARATLQGTGVAVDDPAFSSPPSPTLSSRDDVHYEAPRSATHPVDALRTISKAEVLRLISVYDEEVHSVYPTFDMSALVAQVEDRFGAWVSGKDSAIDPQVFDVSLARIAVAIGKVVDCTGTNQLSRQLIATVEAEVAKSYTSSTLNVRDAIMLASLSIYHFQADQELLAWRRIGTAARAMLELGLHRNASLLKNKPDARERIWTVRLFWCIYILDRRWSIGLSLPFTLQDADIDPELPKPDQGMEYLQCMVDYGKICSNVWQSYPSLGSSAKSFSKEAIFYLEFQIDNWAKSIPQYLRLDGMPATLETSASERILQRLRVLLHLRKNNLTMLINRHLVLSIDCIKANLEGAQSLVRTAEDTVSVLVGLNDAGTMYIRQQAVFNHFLMTALAIIFLAVCHAPADFSNQCRPGFDSAIRLVRSSAAQGSNSRRLWKSIKSLLPQAQEVYANVSASNQAQSSTSTQAQRSAQVTNTSQTYPQPPPSEYTIYTPDAAAGSLNNTLSTQPDSVMLEQYGAINSWDTPGSMIPPLPDITQMTHDLTELYESFETSNFDHNLFNSQPRDHFLDDPELTQLFHQQIGGA